MQEIAHEKIVEIIQNAASDVFTTMLDIPLEPMETRQDKSEPTPLDGVIALVGIGGDWTGTGRILCNPEVSCKLASGLLGMEYSAVDEDVLDAMAEIANMIIGSAKTNFETDLGPLALSVPTVIFGRNYQARSGRVQNWSVVPFKCAGGVMDIRFSLVKTVPTTHPRVERQEMSNA